MSGKFYLAKSLTLLFFNEKSLLSENQWLLHFIKKKWFEITLTRDNTIFCVQFIFWNVIFSHTLSYN